ncbi:MAG: hypothetical protein WCP39_03890 [Chlamydiota bacterium]
MGLELGGEDFLCFGADFFSTKDPSYGTVRVDFFSEMKNSSCYGYLVDCLEKEMKLSFGLIEKICFRNAERIVKNIL